jgi:hypothetical protein
MSTWSDVVSHVRANYEIAGESDHGLFLNLEVGQGRTQVIGLSHVVLFEDYDWLQIGTVFGKVGDFAADWALIRNGELGFGCIGATPDGLAIFRHSVPLRDTPVPSGVDVPMLLVAKYADLLEQELGIQSS